MKHISFYLKGLAAWLYFGLVFAVGNILMFFRWKDPITSKWAGSMLYIGVRRILNFRSVILNENSLYGVQPCIYVCNHQSNIDILTMSKLYPKNTILLGKKELKWFPIFGTFFYGSGHILLDRKNRKNSIASLKEVSQEIQRRKINVWVFPEGTRNRGAKDFLPFKKGAFHLAIESQIPVVPIVHQHLNDYFNPKTGMFCGGGRTLYSAILDPIETKGMTPSDIDTLMASVRTAMEAKFSELEAHAKASGHSYPF